MNSIKKSVIYLSMSSNQFTLLLSTFRDKQRIKSTFLCNSVSHEHNEELLTCVGDIRSRCSSFVKIFSSVLNLIVQRHDMDVECLVRDILMNYK